MTERLRVALVAPIFNNLPVWAARDLGYYADAGLDVEVDVLFGVGRVTDALLGGTADIALGTPESVLGDPSDPPELVIVGGNAGKVANSLIARRGIERIEDLHTIGVSHQTEGTALLVTEMLGEHGMKLGVDFELEPIGVASARWERIQDATLDAGLQTAPHKYLAIDQGYPNLGDIADVVPDYQFTTFNVRRSWAADHADVLRRFLGCVSRATQWMYDVPDAAVTIAARELRTSEDYARRDLDDAVARHSLPVDLSLSEAGMRKVVAVMGAAGTLVTVDPAERVDLSFLPNAARPGSGS